MKQRKILAIVTLLAVVMCFSFQSVSVNADTYTNEDRPFPDEDILRNSICEYNNIKRELVILKDKRIYLKIGNNDYKYIWKDTLNIYFDKYGILWSIEQSDHIVRWYNYDILTNEIIFKVIPVLVYTNDSPYVEDVETFIFDENQEFVIGFKKFSGECYYILTPDEMKSIIDDEEYYPTLRPMSSDKEPTTFPVSTPSSTEMIVSTKKPIATPKPTAIPTSAPNKLAEKISIKKKSGYSCISLGGNIVSKYKLSKGKLTWKGAGKSKTVKQVKEAGFIEKNMYLIYMTKKGKVCTISPKGKIKTVMKKDAKKLIIKNGYVTKIKKKGGGFKKI